MDEQLKQIALNGTAAGSTSAPEVSANLSSAEGMVADVPYRNLALTGNYGRQHASLRSLKLEAFGGAISGVADATLGAAPVFNGVLNTTNIDLQQALTAQKSKAADLVRGRLTSQFKVAGRGSNFEEIKPTLQGNGHIGIADGKLVGLNVVAEALNKINGIPGIDTLITPAVVERHPHVFKDPDTDLRVVDMSLLLNGPKITSHDIHVESVDYKLLGDGWFDMDKNIDLSAHVMMSRQFSDDLRSEKKNVVYLTNQQGEIDIPLIIKGQLPKPSVVPDVQFLVQRAATHAVQQQGTKLINKFLEKKGLGGLLPPGGEGMPEGGPPPNAGGPGGAPPPAAGGPPGGPAPGASGTPVNPFEAFGKMLGGKKPSGESPPGQPPGEPPGPGANPTSSANPLAPLQQLFH
jgi:hypothetical protein